MTIHHLALPQTLPLRGPTTLEIPMAFYLALRNVLNQAGHHSSDELSGHCFRSTTNGSPATPHHTGRLEAAWRMMVYLGM